MASASTAYPNNPHQVAPSTVQTSEVSCQSSSVSQGGVGFSVSSAFSTKFSDTINQLLKTNLPKDFSQALLDNNMPLTPAPTVEDLEQFFPTSKDFQTCPPSPLYNTDTRTCLNNLMPVGLASPTNSTCSSGSGDSPKGGNLDEMGFLLDDLTPFTSITALDVPMLDLNALETLSSETRVPGWAATIASAHEQQDQDQQQTQTQQDDLGLYVKFEEDGMVDIESENSSSDDTSKSPSQKHSSISSVQEQDPRSSQQSKPVKKNPTTRPPRSLECFNCHVTKTPLWRRTPDRQHSLCNACGLYYKQYNTHRPLHIRQKPSALSLGSAANARASSAPYAPPTKKTSGTQQPSQQFDNRLLRATVASGNIAIAHSANTICIRCVNCHQTQTPLWRKNEKGEPICNACGLYAKIHQKDRPVGMKKMKVQKRQREWATGDPLPSSIPLSLSNMLPNSQQQIPSPLPTPSGLSSAQMFIPFSTSSGDPRPIMPAQPSLNPQLQSTVPGVTSQATRVTLGKAGVNKLPRLQTNEFDDSRFRNLLARMNRTQMEWFLATLERRCDILRGVLDRMVDPCQTQSPSVQNPETAAGEHSTSHVSEKIEEVKNESADVVKNDEILLKAEECAGTSEVKVEED